MLKRAARLRANAEEYKRAALSPKYEGQEITFLENAELLENAARKAEEKILRKRGHEDETRHIGTRGTQ